MGAWGTGIFSNDTSRDVRDEFRDLIAEGMTPTDATSRLVESYQAPSDPIQDPDFWLGLALAQHQMGRSTPDVQANAFTVIGQIDKELERWEPSDRRKRRTALEKAARVLAEPLPTARPVRKRSKSATALRPGQHFLYELRDGHRVLMRVTEVADRGGDYPEVVVLDWRDIRPVPEGRDLARLRPHRAFETDDQSQLRFHGKYLGFLLSGHGEPKGRVEVLPDIGAGWTAAKRWRLDARRASSWVTPWARLDDWFDGGRPRWPKR